MLHYWPVNLRVSRKSTTSPLPVGFQSILTKKSSRDRSDLVAIYIDVMRGNRFASLFTYVRNQILTGLFPSTTEKQCGALVLYLMFTWMTRLANSRVAGEKRCGYWLHWLLFTKQEDGFMVRCSDAIKSRDMGLDLHNYSKIQHTSLQYSCIGVAQTSENYSIGVLPDSQNCGLRNFAQRHVFHCIT